MTTPQQKYVASQRERGMYKLQKWIPFNISAKIRRLLFSICDNPSIIDSVQDFIDSAINDKTQQ